MALHALVRRDEPDRLLDLLLISALIEARSCERFEILAEGVKDPVLASLYQGLRASEARHHGRFVALAEQLVDRGAAASRLAGLAEAEGEIVERPCDWVRLHAG